MRRLFSFRAEYPDISVNCEFAGNNDIYGLGVRLGIYLQWATSILTEHLNQAEVSPTRFTGNCYQIAILAGFIRISQFPNDEVLALEGYIVLLLCFAGVWAASLGIQGLRRELPPADETREAGDSEAQIHTQPFGKLVSLILNTGICAYGTWFLFAGIKTLKRAPCQEHVFFFAPAELFGWILSVLVTFFIISLLGSSILLINRGYNLVQQLKAASDQWRQPANSNPGGVAHRSPQSHTTVSCTKLTGSLLALALFVVSIELTLQWNHVINVYQVSSFSQIFPLVIGASGLARTMYEVFRRVVLGDLVLSFRM